MRFFNMVLIVCLLLTVYGCKDMKSVKQSPVSYVYPCYKICDKINIDGLLDEESWRKASSVRAFYIPVSRKEAISKTSARILWDDKYLYFGAELQDKDIYGFHREHDSTTWYDDVFEIFIKPRDDSPHYYEFQVTPQNTTLDMLIVRRGAAGGIKRWSIFESGIITAVKINGTLNNWKDEDQNWSAEIAIPLACFSDTTSLPQINDRWKFALRRYNYSVYLEKGVELSSSAYLSAVDFHLFKDYDTLYFLSK